MRPVNNKKKESLPGQEASSSEPFYQKGRGAQFNTPNRFEKHQLQKQQVEAIDDWSPDVQPTQYLEQQARSLVNKVESPDVGMAYSMNPYGGCEHGCIYCYARNTHEYWGYSAGLDFERKIIVKKNAPQLLRRFLMHPEWQATPISMSGNTDCYQPAEQKFRLTRSLLQVCLDFQQPVGIITKNAGILRDLDLLEALSKKNLVSVLVTITSLQEDLRRKMEPRTTTAKQRLHTIRSLRQAGIHAGVMMGPVIPGLNDQEMPALLKQASEHGAQYAAYTLVRLNGAVKLLFHDWLQKNFPDRANKVWHLIESCHDGQVNDSRFGLRMSGQGNFADLVRDQFHKNVKRWGLDQDHGQLESGAFRRPGTQTSLF